MNHATRSAALLIAASTTGPALAQATFQGVGFLPGDSFSDSSSAFGVSPDGQWVVGRSTEDIGDDDAFLWSANTGMIGLDSPDGAGAFAASQGGTVVVGIGPAMWTEDDGWAGLGHLPGGSGPGTAYATSADGTVIVGVAGAAFPFDDEAFRWTGETGIVGLGYLPDGIALSQASDVSADGQVVAGLCDTGKGKIEAIRWTQETGMSGLGFLPGGVLSRASAISADGAVIVGTSEPEAFRWTAPGGMVSLGLLPDDTESIAYGVSADGSVIVGASTSFVSSRAFIWTDGDGMQDLREVLIAQGADLSGWALEIAFDISSDGTVVVGTGINPEGDNEGWVAYLPRSCYPDLDASGGLDLFDFLAFVNLFNDEDPIADCDADEAFTLFDFLCFTNAFNEGC